MADAGLWLGALGLALVAATGVLLGDGLVQLARRHAERRPARLQLVVARREEPAPGVIRLVLRRRLGGRLPAFLPGQAVSLAVPRAPTARPSPAPIPWPAGSPAREATNWPSSARPAAGSPTGSATTSRPASGWRWPRPAGASPWTRRGPARWC